MLLLAEDGVPEPGDALDALVDAAVLDFHAHAGGLLGEKERHLGPLTDVIEVRVARLELPYLQVVPGAGVLGHLHSELL